jgi:hypothetical protein
MNDIKKGPLAAYKKAPEKPANGTPSPHGAKNNLPAVKPPGYVPKYTPPSEPTIVPAPNVENKVQLPGVLEITTLDDLEHRILGMLPPHLGYEKPSLLMQIAHEQQMHRYYFLVSH